MFANPLSFPAQIPAGLCILEDEPRFDPEKHLALEPPARVWRLADLGYEPETIAVSACDIALAGPFRLLSEEGVAALHQVALALGGERMSSGRTAAFVTGGVYRSTFLRALCQSPEVVDFLSRLCGAPLAPHSLPSQQAYINYAPKDLSLAVDSWHVDSIGLDYVLMVSDPAKFEGGEFQAFHGTMKEAAAYFGTTEDRLTDGHLDGLPPERVLSFEIPAAGYAIFQQGHLVLHRATRLLKRAERITLVSGYEPCDLSYGDTTFVESMVTWGEPGLVTELARHGAWLAREKLDCFLAETPAVEDPAALGMALKESIADLERTLAAFAKVPKN